MAFSYFTFLFSSLALTRKVSSLLASNGVNMLDDYDGNLIKQLQKSAIFEIFEELNIQTRGNIDECHWSGIRCNSDKIVERIELYKNGISTLPTAIGNLINLKYLLIDNAQLTGTIPTEYGLLLSLKVMSLGRNRLNGTIPIEFENLVNLETLDLHSNLLTGSFHSNLGKMKNVSTLLLGNNQLNGTIPVELGNMEVLQLISLEENNLEGEIPSSAFLNLSSLTSLNLSNNKLTGTIPLTFNKIASLQELSLENNDLTGTLPCFRSDQTITFDEEEVAVENCYTDSPSSFPNASPSIMPSLKPRVREPCLFQPFRFISELRNSMPTFILDLLGNP